MARKSKPAPALETPEPEAVKTATVEFLELNPDQINLPLDNPAKLGRYKPPGEEEVCKLAYSMSKEGQLTPIKVVVSTDIPGTYDTVYGNTRTLAARKIREGFTFREVIVKPDDTFFLRAEVVTGTPKDLFTSNMTENAVRNELSIMDKAESFRTAIEIYGFKQERLSQIYNMDKGMVSKIVKLNTLPDSIKELLHGGQLGLSHGMVLCTSKLEEEDMLKALGSMDVPPTVAEINERIRQIKKGETPEEPKEPKEGEDSKPDEPKKDKRGTGQHQRGVKEIVMLLKRQLISTAGSGAGKPDDNQSSIMSNMMGAVLLFIEGSEKFDDETVWQLFNKTNRTIRELCGEKSYDEEGQGEPAGSAPIPNYHM